MKAILILLVIFFFVYLAARLLKCGRDYDEKIDQYFRELEDRANERYVSPKKEKL